MKGVPCAPDGQDGTSHVKSWGNYNYKDPKWERAWKIQDQKEGNELKMSWIREKCFEMRPDSRGHISSKDSGHNFKICSALEVNSEPSYGIKANVGS